MRLDMWSSWPWPWPMVLDLVNLVTNLAKPSLGQPGHQPGKPSLDLGKIWARSRHYNQTDHHHHISGCAIAYIRLCHPPLNFLCSYNSWLISCKEQCSYVIKKSKLVGAVRTPSDHPPPSPPPPYFLKDIVSLTLTLGWKDEKQPSGSTELDLEVGNLVGS